VSLDGSTVTAVKVGRQWMVDAAEDECAIEAHRETVAEKHHWTADYKALSRIFCADCGTLKRTAK
jgi:hypothetical protein